MPLAEAQTTLVKLKIRSVERQYVSLPNYVEKNCFPTQNFTEIGQSAADLWPKQLLQRRIDVRRLEFKKNVYSWSSGCHRVPSVLNIIKIG